MFTENQSTASELDGLPDPARAETQEIIDEIAAEENPQGDQQPTPEGDQTPKDETTDGKPKEGDEPADGKKPEGEEAKTPPAKRTPGLMPRYVHEIAVKEAKAREDELIAELERIKEGKGPESTDTPPTQEQQGDIKEKVATMAKTIAEKHEGISEALIADIANSLVEIGIKPAEIPQDIQEKLKAVDQFTAQQQAQAEEQAFRSTFDTDIVPLIKAEYGDLPDDTISEIRNLLMEKAYSDEFGNTPIGVIFKGLDEFRGFKRTPSQSAEHSRGGHERSQTDTTEGGDTEFENVTDEDIDKMDTPTFDRYTKWAEAREKQGNR